MSLISTLLLSFLSVVLIAFGWMPCCCPSGGIITDCCSSIAIPETLYLTLTHVSGSCTCFDGTVVTLTWIVDSGPLWGPGYWKGSATVCTDQTWVVRFYCNQTFDATWDLEDGISGDGGTCFMVGHGAGTSTTGTCSLPFSVTYSSSVFFSSNINSAPLCCAAVSSGTYTGVITE